MIKIKKILLFSICIFTNLYSDSTLSERLNLAVQPPIFSSASKTKLSGSEIVDKLKPILKSRISQTNYDRTFPIIQFIDYYNSLKKPLKNLSPIEAFKKFKFEPLLSNNRGGPCLTLTLDLIQYIPEELNAYVCLAKLPTKYQQIAFPEYSHSAVLIRYVNPNNSRDCGFVLLDPSFDIDEPILLEENQAPYYYDTKINGIWKFYLEKDKIICEIIKEDSDVIDKMVYLTHKVTNPIESSAMPMLLVDRRLSLLSRKENGLHLAHLNVELNKKRVIWDKDGTRFEPISFDQIKQGWTFPNWFSSNLFLEQEKIDNIMTEIVNNKNIIDCLYFEYISLIKETKDFSITGEIEIKNLDLILNQLDLESFDD